MARMMVSMKRSVTPSLCPLRQIIWCRSAFWMPVKFPGRIRTMDYCFFNGSITPANYNKGWTDLRLQYQGIVPPVERPAYRFDAGAKYHIPGNTPYTRYFLARILQFQFYKAACDISGWKGPLHRCSFYGNKEVGSRLNAMLEMGASKPWPDALQAFTGTREMSGKPMLKYFAPLMKWLKAQNKGAKKGW